MVGVEIDFSMTLPPSPSSPPRPAVLFPAGSARPVASPFDSESDCEHGHFGGSRAARGPRHRRTISRFHQSPSIDRAATTAARPRPISAETPLAPIRRPPPNPPDRSEKPANGCGRDRPRRPARRRAWPPEIRDAVSMTSTSSSVAGFSPAPVATAGAGRARRAALRRARRARCRRAGPAPLSSATSRSRALRGRACARGSGSTGCCPAARRPRAR